MIMTVFPYKIKIKWLRFYMFITKILKNDIFVLIKFYLIINQIAIKFIY